MIVEVLLVRAVIDDDGRALSAINVLELNTRHSATSSNWYSAVNVYSVGQGH